MCESTVRVRDVWIFLLGVARAEGLLGTYYLEQQFNDPFFTRVDEQLNFAWGDVGPFQDSEDPEIQERNEQFSVRWTASLSLRPMVILSSRRVPTMEYAFGLTADY